MCNILDWFKNLLGFGTKKLNAIIIRWRRPSHPTVHTEPKPQPVVINPIEHILNDPTTPDLVVTNMPPTPPLKSVYVVKGYKGGGFPKGSVEFQAANAYVTVGETLNFYNSHTDKPIPSWPRTSVLVVIPRAGVDLNAFYDGRTLQFFYYTDARIGGSVYAVDSADIVSHETGHSILDCYRPDMWNAASIEIAAFHESFGDITALMHAMSHDEMIRKALDDTHGDLKQANVISRLAEQFGRAIFHLDPQGRTPDFLRCAFNEFNYVNPGTLPDDAPDNQLAAEPHSFSRVFTGAFYDIVMMVYEDIRSTGVEPLEAVKQARDLMAKYVMKSIQNAPLNVKFYESMAKTMLWSDVTLNNRKYHDRMHQIFMKRNIVGPTLTMLGAPKCHDQMGIVKTNEKMVVKLSDFVVTAQAHSMNPLFNVEVEIPTETAYLYDNDRSLVHMVSVTQEESIGAAQDMINHLHRTNKVSNDPKTPFEIRDGKLVRTFIDCCHK